MDDLSKKTDMAKLEDLLKELLRNGLKIPQKKCQISQESCNVWVIPYL